MRLLLHQNHARVSLRWRPGQHTHHDAADESRRSDLEQQTQATSACRFEIQNSDLPGSRSELRVEWNRHVELETRVQISALEGLAWKEYPSCHSSTSLHSHMNRMKSLFLRAGVRTVGSNVRWGREITNTVCILRWPPRYRTRRYPGKARTCRSMFALQKCHCLSAPRCDAIH